MRLPFGDDPIATSEDDLLGRNRLAAFLAAEICALDASNGAVVAITGPWGSGKTSLMNLAAVLLRDTRSVFGVIDFNPWLFSGAEQLAENLLTELAVQLQEQETRKAKARRVATRATSTLLKYSESLSVLRAVPVVGPVVEAVDQGLTGTNTLLRGDQSLQRRRKAAIAELASLDRRVVVLVDDIDRLTRAETRDLFRAVRLTASFPNVVYVLCLDHQVVASALNEEGFSGKAYLEKILTVTCRVPELADTQIGQLFIDGLNDILARHDTGPHDEGRWGGAYHKIIRPLFTTVRDAKRVLASLPITLRLIGDELPVVDVVVLECLRTLYPDMHAAIDTYAHALTYASTSYSSGPAATHLKAQITEFVAVDQRFGGRLATDLIWTLFPHAAERLPGVGGGWMSAGMSVTGGVGWQSGLTFYLTHELPPGIASAGSVRAIVAAFGDRDALRGAFDGCPDEHLEDALSRIVEPARAIDPGAVPATVQVLLEQFPRLRTGTQGFLDFGAQHTITRPVRAILGQCPQQLVEEITADLVTATPTIYAAYELVLIVGHREGAGDQLVSEAYATELEDSLRRRILKAGNNLATERELTEMLVQICREEDGQPMLPEVMSLPVAANIFGTAVGVVKSHSIGGGPSVDSRAYNLHWEALTAIFGGENRIAAIASDLNASELPGTDSDLGQALALVAQYLNGWRPSRL